MQVVIVNQDSASASEILSGLPAILSSVCLYPVSLWPACDAQVLTPLIRNSPGALRDNHRAVIVGDTHTYGKGKIQVRQQVSVITRGFSTSTSGLIQVGQISIITLHSEILGLMVSLHDGR